MRILVTDGMDQSAVAALRADGHEVVEQYFPPEELGAALREFDIAIVRSKTKVRKAHIDEALGGRLKLIIRGGVGVDNIDVEYAEEKGIQIRNTPKASSRSVAELTMAHIFSCARFISAAGHTMREGQWEKKAYSKGIELAGKTIGIVGFGRIGLQVGIVAKALGMEVLAYARAPKPELEEALRMRYGTLEEVVTQSDFVTIHTPHLEGLPLISREMIAKMKDGVVIINTSRGGNVDEEALLEGLNSGKIFAAGLDVYAEEPTKNHPLYTHPRVSCTPHIGGATVEAQQRIGSEVVEIIRKFAKG